MRRNVTPFLRFAPAVLFALAWMDQDKGVYLALAVLFAIFGYRSYTATKKRA
jgi:hypothetical protein